MDAHTSRLQRQRLVKAKQKNEPIVEMTKKEVIEKRLENFVLYDVESRTTFDVWWKTVDDEEAVEVQHSSIAVQQGSDGERKANLW